MSTSQSGKKPSKKDDGIIENVIGLVKKSVLAGIGMAFLGEEKIEEWTTKIVRKDIGNFIKDVKKDSIQARKDVEKRLRDTLKELTSSSEEKSSESSQGKSGGSKKNKSHSRSRRRVSSVKAKVSRPETNKEFSNPQIRQLPIDEQLQANSKNTSSC